MNILDNALYKEDIKKSLYQIVGLEKLNGKKILVTGATGLVCSAVVDLCICSGLDITVYAACRNEKKVKERFGNRVKFISYDATKNLDFNVNADYIIHGASNASPDLYINRPVETMQANINGIQNLLEYAHCKAVKKVLFVSSSEVYGKKDDAEPFTENQYGFVDLLNPRSCYAIAKRTAETICASYKAEYGVDFNIVRLGHIYGPSASRLDKRVSSDFIFKAAAGENLILKSDGRQIRSYCYSLDCATAMLSVLICGVGGEAYNISNKKSIISIREISEIIANVGGVELMFNLPSQVEVAAFNPMDNASLNSNKIEALGWNGRFDASTGIAHTVQIIKQSGLVYT